MRSNSMSQMRTIFEQRERNLPCIDSWAVTGFREKVVWYFPVVPSEENKTIV